MPAVILRAPAAAMRTCLSEPGSTRGGFTGPGAASGVTAEHVAALRERLRVDSADR
ncbi:hypothetical protein OG948_44365 (plasmid) [Embleya sp. NBC_00888]|uniref:hypothetical protein n=1 Tax=Embleya sp. NBC_00888 TaxID=2975960 RepID=UPI002F9099C2|nr:hypothetical protein OG948_44365 [Embleya sp. NBC_00888]